MTNEELALQIQNGETSLYATLWDQVRLLVARKVNSFALHFPDVCTRCGVTTEDLMQVGFLALVDAVQAYDPEKKYKLTSYLRFPLKKQIQAALSGGRRRGIHVQDPLSACASLDAPIADSDGDTFDLLEVVPDPNGQCEQEQIEDMVFISQLHCALEREIDANCTQIQGNTLRNHYFGRQTLSRIAANLECSTEYVRHIERQAIERLRKKSFKQLFPFIYPDATEFAWIYNSFSSFKHSGVSGVEKAVEKAEEKRRQFFQQVEDRSKERYQALEGLSTDEVIEYYRKSLQHLQYLDR